MKNFLLVILGMALVVVGLLAIAAVSLNSTFLNPAAYKQAFIDQGVYDKLPAWVAQQLAQAGNPAGEAVKSQNSLYAFRPEDYEALLGMVAPKNYFRKEAESLVDQFFAYLDGDHASLDLIIDLLPVQQNLAGSQASDVARLVISTWPECTAADLARIALAATSGDVKQIPLCQPPDVFMATAVNLVGKNIQQAAGEIPESINLGPAFSQGGGMKNGLNWLVFLQSVLHSLPWIALALAALLFVSDGLLSRSLKYFGTSLAFTGLVALLLVVGFALLGGVLMGGVAQSVDSTTAGLGASAVSVISQVGQAFLLRLGGIGLIAGGAGLVIWVVSAQTKKEDPLLSY